MEGGPFLAIAAALVEVAHQADARLIVNDRADFAVLAGADGVHVGQEDLTPAEVRSITGPAPIVGLSTHTHEQIEAALLEPVSYVAIGPLFPTATKATGYNAVGYELVRHAATRVQTKGLPLVAIGGITLETAPHVIAAGAASVAVITDLIVGDPEARVRQYVQLLTG